MRRQRIASLFGVLAMSLSSSVLASVVPTTPQHFDPIRLGEQFGVIVGPLTEDVRKELSLRLTDGVVVFEVVGSSLAEDAGLKPRVVITEINNRRVHNLKDFGLLLSEALAAGNFTVGTWEPTHPENQGAGQQINFYFVPNRTD